MARLSFLQSGWAVYLRTMSIFCLAWYALSLLTPNKLLLPSPLDVAAALEESLRDGELWRNALTSLARMLVSVALAVAVANTMGHDFYARLVHPRVPAGRRIILTRIFLILALGFAAWLAIRYPERMLRFAAAAPALAAAGLFPPIVLGIWWSRANLFGALAGIFCGFGVTAAPFCTLICPPSTTRSPALRPLVMAALPS